MRGSTCSSGLDRSRLGTGRTCAAGKQLHGLAKNLPAERDELFEFRPGDFHVDRTPGRQAPVQTGSIASPRQTCRAAASRLAGPSGTSSRDLHGIVGTNAHEDLATAGDEKEIADQRESPAAAPPGSRARRPSRVADRLRPSRPWPSIGRGCSRAEAAGCRTPDCDCRSAGTRPWATSASSTPSRRQRAARSSPGDGSALVESRVDVHDQVDEPAGHLREP